MKNNLGPPQPSLAFAVQTQEGVPPTLTWLGPTRWTADQLLAGERTPPTIAPRDRARDFLATALRAGPLTSRELWTLAQKQRLAKRTLFRAKQELDIRIMRVSVDGRQLVYWLLPGQQLPPSVPPEAIPPSLEEWLAPLREQYPPSTPLDDF